MRIVGLVALLVALVLPPSALAQSAISADDRLFVESAALGVFDFPTGYTRVSAAWDAEVPGYSVVFHPVGDAILRGPATVTGMIVAAGDGAYAQSFIQGYAPENMTELPIGTTYESATRLFQAVDRRPEGYDWRTVICTFSVGGSFGFVRIAGESSVTSVRQTIELTDHVTGRLAGYTAERGAAFQLAALPPVAARAPLPAPSTVSTAVTGTRVVANDGQYLGQITSNQFASDSICNQFGNYGSQFSSTSVRNQFSNYGSQFAPNSAYNEFTATPPQIISDGRRVGYLTKNQFMAGAIDPDVLFASLGCTYR